MTKEELEKEAKESWWNDNNCSGALPTEKIYECGYLAGAEPREKRIAELDRNVTYYAERAKHAELQSRDIVIRNKELEKENAELKGIKDAATLIKANNDTVITLMQLNNKLVSKSQQLTKAKELLKKWIELSKPKLEGYPITPIQEQTEQFIEDSEVEK